jgi:hypothetical protein
MFTFYYLEDRDSIILRNSCAALPYYMESIPRQEYVQNL